MKKTMSVLLVLALTFMLSASLIPASADSAPSITAIKSTPVIDGELGDWKNATAIPFAQTISGTEITDSWFKIMWDDNAVYFAAQIPKGNNNNGLSITEQLQILFDFDGLATGGAAVPISSRNAAALFVMWSNGFTPGGPANPQPQAGGGGTILYNVNDGAPQNPLDYILYESGGKWIYESKWVPSAALKAKLVQGGFIGFDARYVVNFTDANSNGTSYMGWANNATKENWYTDLRNIGKVVLGEPPAGLSDSDIVNPLDPTENAAGVKTPSNDNIASDSIILDWNTTNGAASYRVNIFSVSGSNGTPVYTYIKSDNSIIGTSTYIAGLTADTNYAIQVLAINSAGDVIAAYDMLNIKTKAAGITQVTDSNNDSVTDSNNDSVTDSNNDSVSPDTSDKGLPAAVALIVLCFTAFGLIYVASRTKRYTK